MRTILLSATVLFGSTIRSSYALVVPHLPDLTPKVFGSQLDFKVAFGSKENPFQMNGLRVELDGTCQQKSKREGSSGIYKATLADKKRNDDDDDDTDDSNFCRPYFVNDKGLQYVDLENGGWELRWPKTSAHGVLVCSFMVPTELKRNDDAILSAGRFFMHFRIWSKQTLESERQRRRDIQAEAAKALKERDEQVKKLVDQEENNPLTKVVSYGKAAKSMTEFRGSGLEEARFTPLYDDQVLELVSNDCILSTRGLIYKVSETRRELEYAGESRVDLPPKEKEQEEKEVVVGNAAGDA